MDVKKLLADVTALPGVSGHEAQVSAYFAEQFRPLVDEVTVDAMYSVIAHKKGKGPKIMLCAHLDEIALMVTHIEDDGSLRLGNVGGVDPRILPASRVWVHGREKLFGTIGALPPHLMSAADRANNYTLDNLHVDIGAKNKDEAECKAPMGTYISFDTPYVEYGDGFACGKAFDDRVGCLSLLRLLQEELPVDLVACFVSEEEVGCRGAKGAAFQQEPDIGIVLEGTTCNDLGDVPETAHVCEAGQGVTVSFMDGASIANRALFRKALDVAKQENIPHQVKHSVSGGNDGGAIQRAREGVPVVVLSVPCRYIHSPSSVVKLSDVESQFALVKALVKAL